MNDKTIPASELLEPLQDTFDVLPLSAEVRRAVDALGYMHPTPVQKAVFESVAQGKDVVVQARTGTGKTAAFGLPTVDRLVDETVRAPQILILSPTRELALQINREIEGLAKYKQVTSTAIYGGASMQPQIDAIRAGAQIIVGTPGRVLDHLERGTLSPRTLSAIILDESDEMLSMGFLPQITRILEQLPPKHQTLLFSATLPPDVRRIAETRLTDPEFITLSGDHIGALSIDHYVYRSAGNKAEELVQILEIENPESAIIFCNTRDQTKRISTALKHAGYPSDWLNADLAQNDREKVMKATRDGKLRFLVCTDVAARGIDISHLTHVINADFPESTENYVHRTGRTGRAGKTGTAISLIAPQDVGNLYMLRLTYKIFPKERDLPSAGDLQTRKEADLVRLLLAEFQREPVSASDQSLARRLLASENAEALVAGLVRSHLGKHPGAESTAAEARRAKMPPSFLDKAFENKAEPSTAEPSTAEPSTAEPSTTEPSTAETDKGKKHKKKDKKGDKFGKDRSKDRPGKDRSGKDRTDTENSDKRTEKRSARSDDEEITPPKGSAVARPIAASPRATASPGLEVISASALLTEDERALLRGDAPRASSDARRGPRPDAPRGPRPDAPRGPRPDAPREHAPRAAAPPSGEPPADGADQAVRIFVDVGKRDDVFKDDFLDTLESGGISSRDIAYLNIRDTHSFVGVPPAAAERVIAALDGRQIGGLEVTAELARPRRS